MWQPDTSGGSPLVSLPDTGLLNPLSWPYYVLPLWLAPAFVKLSEFIVAIGGMFLYLRRLDRSRLAASIAGIIFAGSGFMVMWSNWPQTRTAAFVPALFWAIERIIQRGGIRDALLVAIVVASLLLGGFPAITGYALYFGSMYLVVRLIVQRGLRRGQIGARVGMAGIGLALGGGISAVQMLPFADNLQLLDQSYRAQNGNSHLPFAGLLTVIAPSANGLCIGGQFQGPTNPIELVAFVGSGAVVLAVVAVSTIFWFRGSPVGRGVRAILFLATLAIVVLGWRGGRALEVAQHFPVFSNNFVGRIRVILGFVLAALSAWGVDFMMSGRARGPKSTHVGGERDSRDSLGDVARHADGNIDAAAAPHRPVGGIMATGQSEPLRDKRFAQSQHSAGRIQRVGPWAWFFAVWATALLLGLHAILLAREATFWAAVRHELIVPVILVGAAMIFALTSRVGVQWIRVLSILVVAGIVVGQSADFFRSAQPGNDRSDFYPVTPAHQYLTTHDGHDRFDGGLGTLYTQTAPYYGLRVATGHTFLTPEWASLLVAIDPRTMLTPTSYSFPALTNAQVGVSPILDRMGVKYFAVQPYQLVGASAAVEGQQVLNVPNAESASCSVARGPLRGILFALASSLTATGPAGLTVNVEVVSGGRTIHGARYLGSSVKAGAVISVAIAGEDLATSAGATMAKISVTGAASAMSVRSSGSAASCAPVRPINDHLKLVFSDAGTIILQRLDALPRIRWASTGIVIPGDAAQVAALETGVPANQVVLSSGKSAGAGKAASIHIFNDSGGRISATVNAAGEGYLVVADALTVPGWSATIDGRVTPLLTADHALVAVQVPAGVHTIRLAYTAPGQRAGLAITGLSIVVILALFLVDLRRARRTDRHEA